MSAAQNIITTAAGVQTYFSVSPFNRDQVARLSSAGAANAYGVNYPGIWNPNVGVALGAQKTLRIGGDGSTVVFSEDDYPLLANAHLSTDPIATASILRVVARVVGIGYGHIQLLQRVGSDVAPSAGEFRTADNGGSTEITLGEAVPEGASLEVWIMDAADIRTFAAPLTANVPLEVVMTDVTVCDTASVTFESIGKGGGS